jgi:hypothetical protein
MTGAFVGQNVGEKFPVIIGTAKLWDENGNVYAAIANEALYDDNEAQVESLLSVHQALADPKNGIDDHAHCEHNVDGKPGRQKAWFGSKEVSFFFDGSKCFFEISAITPEEIKIHFQESTFMADRWRNMFHWYMPTPVDQLNLTHCPIFHHGNIIWDLFPTMWLIRL